VVRILNSRFSKIRDEHLKASTNLVLWKLTLGKRTEQLVEQEKCEIQLMNNASI
jgi:hypothetical protein